MKYLVSTILELIDAQDFVIERTYDDKTAKVIEEKQRKAEWRG